MASVVSGVVTRGVRDVQLMAVPDDQASSITTTVPATKNVRI